MKDKINAYAIDGNKNVFEKKDRENNIIKFIIDHEKEKEYFHDVLIINHRIRQLDMFISKLRKDEYQIFEGKFKFTSMIDEYNKNLHDTIFSALFGTTSFETNVNKKIFKDD